MSGWKNAKRIDFRQGWHNPVVIEFAVRPRAGGRSNLSAGQNQSELHKLTRIQQSAARLRVLLLVDLASDVIDRDDLVASYADVGGGPGAFVHHSVPRPLRPPKHVVQLHLAALIGRTLASLGRSRQQQRALVHARRSAR